MNRADAHAGFWRCKSCGTHNPWTDYLTSCLGCGAARPSRPATESPTSRSRRAPRPPTPLRLRLGRRTMAACWAYAAAMASLVVLISLLGDSWWPPTVLLFGPRWAWALPLMILAPLAVAMRPKALWPLLLASALIVGPLLGYCVPWRAYLHRSPVGLARVRVLTCNVQGKYANVVSLVELIASSRPDIVLLQECPGGDNLSALFRSPEWHLRFESGLGLASRFPIGSVEVRPLHEPTWGGGWIGRYELRSPFGPVHVFCVHLATPREGLEALLREKWRGIPALRAKIEERWHESEVASRWVAESTAPVLLAGDFNMPVESAIYRRYWSRYSNAFSEAGSGFGHTKFTRWHGIRIDHILAGRGWICRRCRVGSDVGSDHRPLIAEMVWVGAAE
jgi:vancomycin resistance protein VanJ